VALVFSRAVFRGRDEQMFKSMKIGTKKFVEVIVGTMHEGQL
jgi:hypothetical protein